jgi:ADP-ribosylglycohydrolase
MRVTPAGVAFWDDPARAAALGARSSLVSHADPRCVEACRVVAACVASLVGGAHADAAWACAAACAELPETNGWMERARTCAPAELGLDEGTRPGEPNRIGYVFLALSAGLSALLRAQTFEEGLLWVVHAGGDADTNGAVAGGLLGARFGEGGIPERWRTSLVPAAACRSAALRLPCS